MRNSKTCDIYGNCNNCDTKSGRLCPKSCAVHAERMAEMVADQVKIGYSVANATAYVKRVSKYLANPYAL